MLSRMLRSRLTCIDETFAAAVTLNVRTGSGSDRVETHHNRFAFSLRPELVMIGVVEHLGNDPVATAPGSDFV